MPSFLIYELMVHDPLRQRPMAAVGTGGGVLVVGAGNARKVTLYDPRTKQALANPVPFNRGKLTFATDDTVTAVSIHGFAPTGHAVNLRNVLPGAEVEIMLDTEDRLQLAQIPFFAGDYPATVEGNSGLDFPVGAVLLPNTFLRVTAIDATETVDIGLLSSESGGDADGLIDGVSVGALGSIVPAVSGTPTLGALLTQSFATTPAVVVPRPFQIAAATSITVTTSAGSDTGEFYLVQPYMLPAA